MKFKYDISVIIPVYNSEEYVGECIESVLGQNFDINRIQIILINDGSIDGSIKVMKKYESENVLVIDKENTGVSDTRNIGLKNAKGKYILFLDSDDSLEKDACKRLFNFFEKHYDEIDLLTYRIFYNKNGKLKPHARYKSMYENGTAVYDLSEKFNLIQTTINVMIKNKFENNPLFDVNLNFSEDERFSTEILMEKKKIGYVEEAIYYYRRHESSATSTITNAYYSFETTTGYYENLFSKYKKNGRVPKYIQALYLNNVYWRIRSNDLFPYFYGKEEFKEAFDRIKNLIKQTDVDVITSLPYTSCFHHVYLLKLKGEKLDIRVEDNGKYIVSCGENIIIEQDSITSVVNKFRVEKNNIILNGNFATLAFEVVKPEIYLEVINKNNEQSVKKIDTFITNHSYYLSKIKTNTIYGYKLKLDIRKLKSFNLYAIINNIKVPITFKFNRFASNKVYYSNIRVAYNNEKFEIKNNSIYYRLKDTLHNIKFYGKKNFRILVYRFLAKLYIKRRKIWLYTDRLDAIDNAYIQFKHDIKKQDNIERYYIYRTSDLKEKFNEKEKKNLIKYRSMKHKILFMNCDKILTSFSDLQIYCPVNKSIKWYRDILKYDLIYLQHGILHANLLGMYSKEYTEISKIAISSNFEGKNLIDKYHYDKEDLLRTGMPRMNKQSKKIEVKNKILYGPSWRKYLIGGLVAGERVLKTEEFLKSKYYKEIYEFLHSEKLQEFLEKNNYKLDFKLHPIFKEYSDLFELENVKNVEINFDKTEIEEYKIFITDFSSFQFDFVRLKRPIIYFVPDMEEFKAGLHTYRELDLKYEDAFGNLCLNSNDLLKEIVKIVKKDCTVDKKYLKRMDEFFLEIKNPCEDIYNEIKA